LRKPSKQEVEDALEREKEEQLPSFQEMTTAMEAFSKFEAVVSLPLENTRALDSLEQTIQNYYKKRTRTDTLNE
jgi:hypothetical protein